MVAVSLEPSGSIHRQQGTPDRVQGLSSPKRALGNQIYTSINHSEVAAPSGCVDKPAPGWSLVLSGWKQRTHLLSFSGFNEVPNMQLDYKRFHSSDVSVLAAEGQAKW